MEAKKKLVILANSDLTQTLLKYFCMDYLSTVYDLEYWVCVNMLKPSTRFVAQKIEREYVKEVASLSQLEEELRNLPKDTIISYHGLYTVENVEFHKVVSKYFKTINFVDFYGNSVDYVRQRKSTSGASQSERPKLFRQLKNLLYKSSFLKVIIKSIKHPKQFKEILQRQRECDAYGGLYKDMLYISCSPGSKFLIHHPDVEQYLSVRKTESKETKKYIVYVDQFFPFHSEMNFGKDVNIDVIAQSHFEKIDAFFDRIEKYYECKVIIAAHPTAEYAKNPFKGREIIYHKTAELVCNSIGVLTHASNALSYVMLADKPVALLSDSEIKLCTRMYEGLLLYQDVFGVDLYDLDSLLSDENEISIRKIDPQIRKEYIETYFGNIEETDKVLNNNLLVQNFNAIYDTYCINYKQ